MKRLFSILLGGLVLMGAATLGLQSGTASAAARNDKHYRHHHRHHHRHHRHKDHTSW